MIGFVLVIVLVGKWFANLAFGHNKNRWLYGILGVVSYYGGAILFGVVLGVLSALEVIGDIEKLSNTTIGLITMPVGALTCWLFFRYLRSRWSREPAPAHADPDILDQNLK